MINGYKIHYMNKERLFLEFVREYINYKNIFFVKIFQELDKENLNKMIKKYKLKNVIIKINKIKNVYS
jgi:hypothetical protein